MSPHLMTRLLLPSDLEEISALHARVFGPGRFARSAYRVREGTEGVSRFCRGAFFGERLIAALRMTEVAVGGRSGALLLGPLAVAPEFAGQGFGRQLIAETIEASRAAGVKLIVLVGDEPYYGRFGFRVVPNGQVTFPGPADPARILAAELVSGALNDYRGLVAADR